MMKYQKSELTYYEKKIAKVNNHLVNDICMTEEIHIEDIFREILGGDKELLFEISKRFAKYTEDESAFFYNSSGLEDFNVLMHKIIDCCEENDWFDKNSTEN